MEIYKKAKGRGSVQNVSGRFDRQKLELDDAVLDFEDYEAPSFKTEFFRDASRSILSKNQSPDIGFNYSLNPYRGCEHGCSYCYARPTHEYLGHSAGLDFETKIYVKETAHELLEQELAKKRWTPQVIMMSGNTDCYQPAERRYEITRRCLEVLAKYKNPVGIITKNALVCRDIDILAEMAAQNLVEVCISLTTLNSVLARKLEPRTSSPEARLQAIRKLSQAGVPVSINMAPIVPGLTDHEIPNLLKTAKEHGAYSAGFTILRLPLSVKEIFSEWLEHHLPERKSKVLSAIFDIRQGKLNQADFGLRMRGSGERSESIARSFQLFKRKVGLDVKRPSLALDLFKVPEDQMSFDL